MSTYSNSKAKEKLWKKLGPKFRLSMDSQRLINIFLAFKKTNKLLKVLDEAHFGKNDLYIKLFNRKVVCTNH